MWLRLTRHQTRQNSDSQSPTGIILSGAMMNSMSDWPFDVPDRGHWPSDPGGDETRQKMPSSSAASRLISDKETAHGPETTKVLRSVR